MIERINLIFMGGFDFPHGMTGTRRILNVINGLKIFPDITMAVVVLRQSNRKNTPDGNHNGIPYE